MEHLAPDLLQPLLLSVGNDRISSWKQLQLVCRRWREILNHPNMFRFFCTDKIKNFTSGNGLFYLLPHVSDLIIITRMPKREARFRFQHLAHFSRIRDINVSCEFFEEKFCRRRLDPHEEKSSGFFELKCLYTRLEEECLPSQPLTDRFLARNFRRFDVNRFFNHLTDDQIIKFAGYLDWNEDKSRRVSERVFTHLVDHPPVHFYPRLLFSLEVEKGVRKKLVKSVKIIDIFCLFTSWKMRDKILEVADVIDWTEISRLMGRGDYGCTQHGKLGILMMEYINWDIGFAKGLKIHFTFEEKVFWDLHPQKEATLARWSLQRTDNKLQSKNAISILDQ